MTENNKVVGKDLKTAILSLEAAIGEYISIGKVQCSANLVLTIFYIS